MIVFVVLGHFAGCFGPIVDMRAGAEGGYEYLVQATCHGPHNVPESHEHEQRLPLWLPARELSPARP